MSAKISISRPVVKVRPVQRHRIVVRANDKHCDTVELSDKLHRNQQRIREVSLSFCGAARMFEITSPVYKRLRYPLIVLTAAQLVYFTTLVIFPRFTVILSTATIVIFLSLQPLALVYKLLLSNTHNFLYRLESHLTIFYASLQAFLDRHLDSLVTTDLEEKARNGNPADLVTPEPWKRIPQKTLISCPSPKIPPSQCYPTPTQGGDLGAQPTLHRQSTLGAVPEFDKEGWLLVCDPDLGLQVPNQGATPEPLRNSMSIAPGRDSY